MRVTCAMVTDSSVLMRPARRFPARGFRKSLREFQLRGIRGLSIMHKVSTSESDCLKFGPPGGRGRGRGKSGTPGNRWPDRRAGFVSEIASESASVRRARTQRFPRISDDPSPAFSGSLGKTALPNRKTGVPYARSPGHHSQATGASLHPGSSQPHS